VPPADVERQRLAALVRASTLFASEIAFAGLFAYILFQTWDATSGQEPEISTPVASAAGALAVALAAGYAGALGMTPTPGVHAMQWFNKKNLFSTEALVLIGVFLYMAIGAACGLTYLAKVEEAPGIVKTVAVAFGGYAIAYIGAAYRQVSQ
jgi:hypothetical protein